MVFKITGKMTLGKIDPPPRTSSKGASIVELGTQSQIEWDSQRATVVYYSMGLLGSLYIYSQESKQASDLSHKPSQTSGDIAL